jgi:hypothetical protein
MHRAECIRFGGTVLMQTVSRFEVNLLYLLYFFLRREPLERVAPLIESGHAPPACLSRGAVRLIADALKKGCVRLLAERGGWRRERFLRDGRPVEGRLWERTAPADLGLTFSPQTLVFLRWITAVQPDAKQPLPLVLERLTDGDRLLLFFAHEGLRQYCGRNLDWQTLPGFADHGLCRLAYPDDFARAGLLDAPDFALWTTGVGACVLEALQNDLAARWVEVEGHKQSIQVSEAMRQLGEEQERVLTAFLAATERQRRWDLARFLLRTASCLLPVNPQPDFWVGSVRQTKQRLAERTATYAAALAFLRQVDGLRRWDRQARLTGYFDEGYQAAQLWKADWEEHQGDLLVERAHAVIRRLDPLRQT